MTARDRLAAALGAHGLGWIDNGKPDTHCWCGYRPGLGESWQYHVVDRLMAAGVTMPADNDWSRHMRSMLGKQVTVTLDREQNVETTGLLLSFTNDGEVTLRDEDGAISWSWPNLETRLADGRP